MEMSFTEKVAGIAAAIGAVALIAGYLVFVNTQQIKTRKEKSKKSSKSLLSSLPPTPSISNNGAGWGKKSQSLTQGETSDLRGYKKLDDGRVTTYFNREISQRDKEIIGDCSPKLLSQSTSSAPQHITATPGVQSAWNAAGTWEEKDCSVWARQQVSELLKNISCRTASGSIVVTSIRKPVEGDAAITVIRGKKKYIYDLSTELNWKFLNKSNVEEMSGTVTISDITGECAYDILAALIYERQPTNVDRKKFYSEYIAGSSKGLQVAISEKLNRFLADFKALYP